MNPVMPRRFSEIRVVKGGIWIQREKNRRRKLEKKQQRMKNTLSGGEGECAHSLHTFEKTDFDHAKN